MVTDLASLTADQLAEKVLLLLALLSDPRTPSEADRAYREAAPLVAELQTRANDQTLAWAWRARAEAAEKERDEARQAYERVKQQREDAFAERDRARANIAVSRADAEGLARLLTAAEKERDEARARKLEWQKRAGRAIEAHKAAEARLAETQKALEQIVAAADADAALNLRDVAFIARAALTTHPADE